MRGRIKPQIVVLIALSTLMGLICIVSFVNTISWIGKPFAGFTIYDCPYVGSISLKDWEGRKAGLKYLERVVSVDGQAVSEGQDVVDAVQQKKPGTPVKYVVESKGETREVTVPVTIFGLRDFFLAYFGTAMGGIVLCILGVIVVLMKPNMSASWVFLGLCFSLGGYMVTSLEILATYSLVHFHYFVLSIFPFTFFHLGLIFPDRKRLVIRFPAIEYLIYLPALILAVFYQIYFFNFQTILSSDALSWLPNYKMLGTMARIFTLIGALSLIICVLHSMFKASTLSARVRSRMILFGVTIAFLPSAASMVALHFLKVGIPFNLLVFFVIVFPASIAYSIVMHNLFDADKIIRYTIGYVVVTGIIVGVYAVVSIGANMIMGKYQMAQSKAFPIIFTLGFILVFNPLRDRIQALVDRLFFRKEYDYGAIVEKVSGAMTSLLELPLILKQLVQTFMDDMFIDNSSVVLLTPDGTQYRVHLADGEQKQEIENKSFKREDPLFEIIEDEKRELTKYDILEDPKYNAVSESSAEDFEALHASLMVPLVYQNQVIGSLNLGEKKSGKPFNREDIDLLRTLAHQGAVAIENARLFQENLEKQRMEEELNIARDLQMSMLPATCPEIKGFQIAASSTPAREVGGDFYDFIEMGEDKAGMVVADVTGKSVSGALVMSSSRSVFRMLSEEDLTVSESMMRANRRLKKDIKTGMFVALLFVVLDSKDQTLTLCSAGQTQPVHLSSKTGKASLVETEGDTFPLGILDEANYEETKLQLSHGDRVLFYTDGIVEAMNDDEEMFGFERLLKTVEDAKAMGAEELLNDILDKVNAFAGGAEQHDDLTVIVVSVSD